MRLTLRGITFFLVWALFAGPALCANAPEPLRVVIVGLVHGHVEGFLSSSAHRSDIRIDGVSDPDRSLFDRYAAKFGLDSRLYHADSEEMLRTVKPQAALVYSSTFDHTRIVEICAKYHIAVMMEKPLATTLLDARAIERAAHDGQIQVLVNYETSWYPNNHALFDLVHAGDIGDVRKAVVHDGHEGPKEIGVSAEFLRWLTDPKLNGAGALFDFGCYGADLMTWLMDGQRPTSVTAVTQRIKPDIYPNVDDEATIVLTYPKAQAILQASWNWPFSRKDMEVYGRTGYAITVGPDELKVRRRNEVHEQTVTAPKIAPPYGDSLSYLRAVVVDGAKPDGLSSLETNIIVTEILDAARQSAATGKTVNLKP
ncbi:MAG TPA: Gfo/Idh/MocA family oxidoreductase [Candidatus Saccharimonadales bacterium]|nr:Gfo/Idh/MocA family oxidoreductase [Candidatus Saccharimonadales bacterium]